MKRWNMAALGLALAASLVACNTKADDKANDASRAGRDAGAAVGTTGANAERDFVEDQLEDGQAEVTLSKMAEEKATNPQVKEFARMMVQDHTKAGEELKQAAAAANIPVTEHGELDRDHKNAQEELAKASGPDFDRKYMDTIVEEHEEAVNELEKRTSSDVPQVRQWATNTLPKVRQHLEQAKQIKQSLEQSGTTR